MVSACFLWFKEKIHSSTVIQYKIKTLSAAQSDLQYVHCTQHSVAPLMTLPCAASSAGVCGMNIVCLL